MAKIMVQGLVSENENLREIEIDKLADIVRNSMDMKKIYEIINL